jgi:hypothetical protein
MEVCGQLHARQLYSRGSSPPVLIVQEAGWAPDAVWILWRRGKHIAPTGNRTTFVQSVARRYTELSRTLRLYRDYASIFNTAGLN